LGSVVVDPRTISVGLPLLTLPLIVFSGFYKNIANLSPWNGWIQYLSPIKYAFGAMVWNQ
jgi:ATP-binding cassette, subfamily G (WHITE), eye pigment precursor transporter